MKKALVAYFSASGETEKLARTIAGVTGGALFEIAPETAYTAADLDWMDKKSRSTLEMNDETSRPAIAGRVEDMAQYDTVFVGFGISEEHLREKRYDRYDGAFLLLDEADRFDGAFLSLPEKLCVCVRFHGHHLQSPEQYRRRERFMAEHRLRLSGFSREITLIDQGFTGDTGKFVTEVCIPVTEEG